MRSIFPPKAYATPRRDVAARSYSNAPRCATIYDASRRKDARTSVRRARVYFLGKNYFAGSHVNVIARVFAQKKLPLLTRDALGRSYANAGR